MKSLILLISVVLLLSTTTSTQCINLLDAKNSNQISVIATSIGGYSGETVELSITNKLNRPISIKLPAGYEFQPENSGEQTLLNIEEEVIALAPKATQVIPIHAYCIEASDRCPTKATTFTITQNTSPSIKEALQLIQKRPISEGLIQDALWAVTDNTPISNIYAQSENEELFVKDLALLTKQVVPWYQSPQNRRVTETGEIESKTFRIEGELRIDVPNDMEITQRVTRSDGSIAMQGRRFMRVPKANNLRFQFKVEVTNWKPGTYKVDIVSKEDKVIKTYDFTVV